MATKFHCPYLPGGGPEGLQVGNTPCPLYGRDQKSPLLLPRYGARACHGDVDALIIGKAPDNVDDSTRKTFAGASGAELTRGLVAAGIDPERCIFTYAVWCAPCRPEPPTASLIKLCSSCHLMPKLLYNSEIRPRVIIACGATALAALYPKAKYKLAQVLGTILPPPASPDISFPLPPVVAVYSPSFVVRNAVAHLDKFRQGLVTAAAVIEGETAGEPHVFMPDEVFIATTSESFNEALLRLHDLVVNPRKAISFDVETSGLNPWSTSRTPRILTFSISVDCRSAIVIGFDHPGCTFSQEQKNLLSEMLRRLLQQPSTVKTAHNIKFDLKWIKCCLGWEVKGEEVVDGCPGLFDTMLAAAVADPGSPMGLDALVHRYAPRYGTYWEGIQEKAKVEEQAVRKTAKAKMTDEDKHNAKENRYDYSLVPIDELASYNAMDTMATMGMVEPLIKRMCDRSVWDVFVNVAMPAAATAFALECNGMVLDEDNLILLVGEAAFNLEEARSVLFASPVVTKFVEVYGGFNPASTVQKARLLFGSNADPSVAEHPGVSFNLTPTKLTKTDSPSCDRKGLIELMRGLDKDGPIWRTMDAMLTLAEEEKILSTYLRPARLHVGSDGRIHATYNVAGARSGRWSSSRPNLQNQPGHIRKMFKSRFDGGMILSADYAALESRVIACYCKDPTMLDIFLTGKDPHIINAGLMLGKNPGRAIKDGPDKDWGDVTPEDRDKAKGAVTFGLAYGRHESSLAKDLGIPIEEAAAMRDSFFASVPLYVKWMNDVKRFVVQSGYVTTMFGRRRDLPDVWSTDRYTREESLRIAINTPIQGTGADITACALVRLYKNLLKGGYRSCIIATVHDSIVVDLHPDEIEEVASLVKATMEDVSMYPWAIVPFTAEVKVERRWDDGAKRRKKR